MSKSDEINAVFLNEIACSVPHFNKIKEKCKVVWLRYVAKLTYAPMQPVLSKTAAKNC